MAVQQYKTTLRAGGGGFQPITATTHYSYEADYESVRETLEQVFNQVDLLEPFQRIATAYQGLVGKRLTV